MSWHEPIATKHAGVGEVAEARGRAAAERQGRDGALPKEPTLRAPLLLARPVQRAATEKGQATSGLVAAQGLYKPRKR